MELFIPLFIAVLVLSLKPGPYMMAFMSMAMNGNWKSMLVFWSGTVIAGTIMYIVLLTGLSFIPLGSDYFVTGLKSAAALLFIILGLKSLSKGDQVSKKDIKETEKKMKETGFFQTILAGFFLTLCNPYDLTFVLAVIPTLTNQLSFSLMEILTIRGVVVVADALVLLAYCLPILYMRKFLADDTLYNIRVLSSTLMIGIGTYLLWGVLTQWGLLNPI